MGKAPSSPLGHAVEQPLKNTKHRADTLMTLAYVATLVLLGIAVWIFLTYTTSVGAAVVSLLGIR